EFQEFLQREFPEHASEWEASDRSGRRRFLKLMGASLALAGVTACTRQPTELIMPYVRAPEEVVPGKPLFYATALELGAPAIGVLVESHMGRPTKIEGNPLHPASLGATDVFSQAGILSLYDPDRSKTVTFGGEIRPWTDLLAALREALVTQEAGQGAGLRILTDVILSPTLGAQLEEILARLPKARWHQWDPVGPRLERAGARLAFGADVNTIYRLEEVDVIASLDADFLGPGARAVRHARSFAERRNPGKMNRLYAVETSVSNTGAKADHRLALPFSRIEALARELAAAVGVAGIAAPAPGVNSKWAAAVARDLAAHRGRSLVIAGEPQPAAVHALAHAMNQALGNAGRTVVYTEPIEARPVDPVESLRELAREMAAGSVELLVIVGANPVYTAPADLRFREALDKVKLRVHMGLYADETAELCHWHVAQAHPLESWGDTRAFDGTATIQQPLIAPLYAGRTAYELMAAMAGQPQETFDIVRSYWKAQVQVPDFEAWWRQALHDGIVPGTQARPRPVALRGDWAAGFPAPAAESGLELVFRADPSVYDGRFANNGWLQECPKPLTKITWGNAVLISPRTAEELGLRSEDGVELEFEGRQARGPVWILPGHADHSLTVSLGYGRWRAGRTGNGVGFNAYPLRTSGALWQASGVRLRKTGAWMPVATTQNHFLMEGRGLARTGTLETFRRNPEFVHEMGHNPPPGLSLYPEHRYDQGYSWGMAIDIGACVGCNACVVACQAENNIPVAGKEQVMAGRELHWLRIDTYYQGNLDDPGFVFQPVLCMHCEKAPCEVVCPVAATVHHAEGLNDMIYNRCVGTRYCSNNCPYKVRRFNFFP
ncbi:MAG: 4Fe-4S dicluster domain-containing protein, partial [Acidobacteria bacterium]|nr:4Fe-4S dicluster domain-containing protein [Acidobacteriota bacterium]